MKSIDILAFAAHPDDVELAAAGTLLRHKKMGHSIGIVDLTRGELGSRGSGEVRLKEAAVSAKILDLDARENLDLGDGFFEINEENKKKIITAIRKYQPKIVLANSITDRHPDHGRAAQLVSESCFLSGLVKVETTDENGAQTPHRPNKVFHYIQDEYLEPSFTVDISEFYETKMKSIQAFTSQFHHPDQDSCQPETPISSKEFIHFLEARARQFGRIGNCTFAEGFIDQKGYAINNLFDLK